jgi:ribosomal protein S18 acetylase RimI-like enzyme
MDAPGPAYREARSEDAGEIVRLIASVAAENQWIRTELPFDMAERERRMVLALEAQDMVTILAETGGTAVGEVTLLFHHERASLAMVIEAAYRGKRIGAALMALAIEKARERAAMSIELAVYSHNVPALSLYRSFGFVEHGPPAAETRSDGQVWHAIPMVLKLA